MNKEYSAGAIVYRKTFLDTFEYLIVQSTINQKWGFPKGHIEGNETPQAAAEREVFEEVGLKPKFDFNFVRKTEYSLTSTKLKEVTYFLAKMTDNQKVKVQAEEIKDYKWVDENEAQKYLHGHDKLKFLHAAEKYLENNVSLKK